MDTLQLKRIADAIEEILRIVKKDYGRSFNCNVDLNGNIVHQDQLEQATRSSKLQAASSKLGALKKTQ